MAKVAKGPGQAEVNGDLRDPRDSEHIGLYRDPASGAELEVTMPAGADALVRMGWEFVRPPADPTTPENRAKRANAPKDSRDIFTETKDSTGSTRYFKNGRRISAAIYEAERPA
jgi:hypothetical protein